MYTLIWDISVTQNLIHVNRRPAQTRGASCVKNKGDQFLGTTKNVRQIYESKFLIIIYNNSLLLK